MRVPAFLFLGFLFLNSACKEVKEKLLPAFNVNIPPIKLTVPPIPFVFGKEIPIGLLRTPINMDSTIKANTAGTLGAQSVHIVNVKKIEIRALNADKKTNLSNFESARMLITAGTASQEIAVINFPNTYTDYLTFTPTNSADIRQFLNGSSIGYNLYWKNRKATSKFLKLDVRITMSVQ